MKKTKIGTLFITIILILTIITASYASWYQNITITGEIKTGNLKWEIVEYSETWAYKNTRTDQIEYYDHKLTDPPNNLIYIADAQAYQGKNHDVEMTFHNVFPYVNLIADFIVHYTGSVPVKIQDTHFEYIDGYDFTPYIQYHFYKITKKGDHWIWGQEIDPTGYQMHYCDHIGVKVTLLIDENDNNMQSQTGTFGGEIKLIQWNEYENPEPPPVPPEENSPPAEPYNPDPENESEDVSRTGTVLTWECYDPDGDPLTYDVYFDTVSPPVTLVSDGQTGTSYDPGDLGYGVMYYWRVIAEDDHGHSTSGGIWHFTTEEETEGSQQDERTGGTTKKTTFEQGNDGDGNKDPTADADGPYYEFVNVEITFNGTGSHDNDENGKSIKRYDWKFTENDEWHKNIGATPTHTYDQPGEYNVTLRVYDDENSMAIDKTLAVIKEPNYPPTKPIPLNYTTIGKTNISYNYTVISIDANDDDIKYIFSFGDGTTASSSFLPNGTIYTTYHSWGKAGVYHMWIEALDNYDNGNGSFSGKTNLTVLINSKKIGDIGYLVDEDDDGIYDIFQNKTGVKTDATHQNDGTYLIDSDSDGKPDHIYNPDTDEVSEYTEGKGEETLIISLLQLIILLTIITGVILTVFLLALGKHKKVAHK